MVDFPLPLGPTKASVWPRFKVNETFSSATTCLLGYTKPTSSNSILSMESSSTASGRSVTSAPTSSNSISRSALLSISLMLLIWREMGWTELKRFWVSVRTSKMSPGVYFPFSAPHATRPKAMKTPSAFVMLRASVERHSTVWSMPRVMRHSAWVWS